MCSIGGFISAEPLDPELARRLAFGLIWYGQTRGRQSAGIWSNGKTVKRALEPEKFIGIRAARELMAEPTCLVLTHTRMPTCGGTGDQQAQPFVLGDTVTVHNGHVSNIDQMIKKHGLTKASGVDSELFTSFVQTHGLMALPDFMSDISGSAALGIVREGKELYLVRDSNPTEYYCGTADGIPFLIFGSTEDQILNTLRGPWLMPPGLRTKTTSFRSLMRAEPTGVTTIAEVKWQTQYPIVGMGGSYRGRGFNPDTEIDTTRRPKVKARWDNKRQCMVDPQTNLPIVNWSGD